MICQKCFGFAGINGVFLSVRGALNLLLQILYT